MATLLERVREAARRFHRLEEELDESKRDLVEVMRAVPTRASRSPA